MLIYKRKHEKETHLTSQYDPPPALTGSNHLFQTTTVYIPNSGKSERSKRRDLQPVHVPNTPIIYARKNEIKFQTTATSTGVPRHRRRRRRRQRRRQRREREQERKREREREPTINLSAPCSCCTVSRSRTCACAWLIRRAIQSFRMARRARLRATTIQI